MVDESGAKADPFRASLIGGICAAVAVLVFLGLHYGLHWAAMTTADVTPLVQTNKLMRPLAGAAIPMGLAIGLAAGKLRRFRTALLLPAGMVAYVLTSIIATAWLKPPALGQHSLSHWIGQGMWAALTYALVAGAPLVVAFVAFERLTRPPTAEDDEAGEEADETDVAAEGGHDDEAHADAMGGRPDQAPDEVDRGEDRGDEAPDESEGAASPEQRALGAEHDDEPSGDLGQAPSSEQPPPPPSATDEGADAESADREADRPDSQPGRGG